MKIYDHTKTCTQMFTAALFIIAVEWEQYKCPPTDERIKKTYHEYRFALKGKF